MIYNTSGSGVLHNSFVMASSTSHKASVEDLCANMSLDEEEDVLVLEDISDETVQMDF